ncbi:MAG: translation elongation factor Ts [Desulfofustis sp. PB-SRB1]|jgi:elongation factor Ts|nr:translation elongation factor Ts [Desulfofustis sp. PB-SRB1]MBM1002429.1 translation elongation factor Ts [Desulfofustis sp. PB-SRB1]HBH30045.1 translation elongation factor Ts [Desulfofustis sp.]HBH31853.1 translation elongation factor Ts [Desulfofustis sp.]
MKITTAMVKELRDKTSAGMMDCKKALTETDGDMDKAVDLLRKKGLAVAAKRAGRATSEGVVETYIHAGGKLGVMIELNCETDFVAKTDQFRELARDIAMHVAASNPVAVERDGVPADLMERERQIYVEQAEESGKPANIVEKIVAGKIDKFLAEVCLLEQKFVKDPERSVQDLITDCVGKMGENISIKRFARFQIGVE